eukprot:TRINITY_DN51_c0_g1_i3.p1 TRINITY_DN51_c0_g1~~TRINITY_DN51_c0_g1_i3.p1  ORF type:complete len:594 (-),score=131.29 TRINITY_DN51_c0_g1_i3:146-1858(-)
MAVEQRGKGTNVMLGPMMNIARVPQGGRNFESFGEDPYLAAQMAEASVRGIQGEKMIACAKHFVNNNQEYHRTTVSANVDERTQWEIYYPAFQAAVDADVGSIMCSYNKINNTWACENPQTLGDLKERMGFKGWVMSDWGATHTTVQAANAGLDQQMPDASYFGQKLVDAVNASQVKMDRIDDMAVRMLTAMYAAGLFDETQPTGNLGVDVQSPQHVELARRLAVSGTVLLKNERNFLPIDPTKHKTIAVIGDDAQNAPIATGGGSGGVRLPYLVTPLQGIKAALANTSVTTINYAGSNPVANAASVAKSAELAIVFVSCTSSEGSDRPNLQLPNGQDALIEAVIAAQPNTVVVLHHPGSVLMPWVNSTLAILAAFLPGQEDGNAIADILFGKAVPGGKLPVTFTVSETQTPVSTPAQYPGINDEAAYSEGLLVGYRWYDAKHIEPLFPFGHGLSYSEFVYTNLKISGKIPISVSVTIANVGHWSASEVAQLYIGFPTSAGEPPQGLRGFKKVVIEADKNAVVTFEDLKYRDFSIWDVTTHNWKLINGNFTISVGSSSRDIRQAGYVIIE